MTVNRRVTRSHWLGGDSRPSLIGIRSGAAFVGTRKLRGEEERAEIVERVHRDPVFESEITPRLTIDPRPARSRQHIRPPIQEE